MVIDRDLNYVMAVGYTELINFSLDSCQFANCTSIGDMETYWFFELCQQKGVKNYSAFRVVSDDPTWIMDSSVVGEVRKLCHFDEVVTVILIKLKEQLVHHLHPPACHGEKPPISDFVEHLKKSHRQMNNKLIRAGGRCAINDIPLAEYQRLYLNSLIEDLNSINNLTITLIKSEAPSQPSKEAVGGKGKKIFKKK